MPDGFVVYVVHTRSMNTAPLVSVIHEEMPASRRRFRSSRVYNSSRVGGRIPRTFMFCRGRAGSGSLVLTPANAAAHSHGECGESGPVGMTEENCELREPAYVVWSVCAPRWPTHTCTSCCTSGPQCSSAYASRRSTFASRLYPHTMVVNHWSPTAARAVETSGSVAPETPLVTATV